MARRQVRMLSNYECIRNIRSKRYWDVAGLTSLLKFNYSPIILRKKYYQLQMTNCHNCVVHTYIIFFQALLEFSKQFENVMSDPTKANKNHI